MSKGEAGIVTDVVIVGGGPAGILLAHHFREHGIRHKVLERGKVGQSWRDMRPGMVLPWNHLEVHDQSAEFFKATVNDMFTPMQAV